MASDQPGIGTLLGMSTLSPEEVTSHELPVALRGYDREHVDRLLARIADAYALTWRQSQSLRERLRTLEAVLEAAEAEAAVSAKTVAELMRRPATEEQQLARVREAHDELEALLEISESERKQALTDLEQMSERASELGKRLEAAENERSTLLQQHVERGSPPVADGEAVELLVAAARAAEDVRTASRARALRTLTRARELSTRVHAETERESAALAELQARRDQIEREATEIIAAARAEADRAAAANADQRHRVRELLSGALAQLDTGAASLPDGLLAELQSPLRETTEPGVT